MSGSPEQYDEAYFYWCIKDFESLLDQYGAEFVLKNCMIDDIKLLQLYDALTDYFTEGKK